VGAASRALDLHSASTARERCAAAAIARSMRCARSSTCTHTQSLYTKLAHDVLPMFYANRSQFISMMKAAIAKNAAFFSAHRMMQRYAVEAYVK
jgi:hypothetical protein